MRDSVGAVADKEEADEEPDGGKVLLGPAEGFDELSESRWDRY